MSAISWVGPGQRQEQGSPTCMEEIQNKPGTATCVTGAQVLEVLESSSAAFSHVLTWNWIEVQ